MMKPFLLICLLAVLLPDPARAQRIAETSVGLGAAAPLGPQEFKQGWSTGFNGYASLGFYASQTILLSATIGINSFGVDTGLFGAIPGLEINGGTIRVFELLVAARHYLHPDARIRVYTFSVVQKRLLTIYELATMVKVK